MSHDDTTSDPEAGSVDPNAQMLGGVLSDPAVWGELEPGLEDRVVDAISAEASATEIPIRSRRRWAAPIGAAVAAALLLVVGFVALTRESSTVDVEVVMSGTELAPDALASLGIETTPNGTRLELDITGLPPAPEGQVYEAWLRMGPEVGVSAGTFHMRGGDGELELWSGVLIEDYPLVTVTIQDEADTASSGQVVLRALVEQ